MKWQIKKVFPIKPARYAIMRVLLVFSFRGLTCDSDLQQPFKSKNKYLFCKLCSPPEKTFPFWVRSIIVIPIKQCVS